MEVRKRFLLIGSNLKNSLSPAIHNAALRKLGIRGEYMLCQISEKKLDETIASFKHENGLVGFNVTTPYKEKIFPYLSKVDLRSKDIGAVNTVKRLRNGRMIGYNTDVDGILASLEKIHVPNNSMATILGAGGASRACAYTLIKRGCKSLVILNRTRARAERLLQDFQKQFPRVDIRIGVLDQKYLEEQISNCDLLINAITNPFPLDISFTHAKNGMKLFDLWYGRPTNIFQNARKSGIRSINGFLMLVEQAAQSIEIWTGKPAPRSEMYAAGKRELSSRERFGSF